MVFISLHLNITPKKILLFVFHLIGILLATYFVTKQILHYGKNHDKSSFHFKRYHTTKEDNYPTFSICFVADDRYPITLYQDDIINNTLNVETIVYQNMMIGKTIGTTNFSLLQYDDAKWDLRIMLNSYQMNDKLKQLRYWDDEMEIWKSPFYIGYQDPFQICMTRNSTFEPGKTMYVEYLRLDTRNWIGEFQLFIHYPGQLMTQIYRRPTLSIDLTDLLLVKPSYSIGVSQLQILRKRQDSSIGCNSDLDSTLDMRWREEIMISTNCIPTYWKYLNRSMNFQDRKINDCITSQDYSNLADVLSGFDEINYEQSCIWPTIITNFKQNSGNQSVSDLRIDIFHESEYYIEIRHSKEIKIDELWSQIGGLIGIFLGYSLLHVPNIVFCLIMEMKNCCYKENKLNDSMSQC